MHQGERDESRPELLPGSTEERWDALRAEYLQGIPTGRLRRLFERALEGTPDERALAKAISARRTARIGARVLAVALALAGVYGLDQFVHLLQDLAPRAAPYAARPEIQFLSSFVVVFIFGRLFFEFRRRERWLYGCLEVYFAFLVATSAMKRLAAGSDGLPEWVGVVAAVYLAVRGFDNISEGKVRILRRIEERKQAEAAVAGAAVPSARPAAGPPEATQG